MFPHWTKNAYNNSNNVSLIHRFRSTSSIFLLSLGFSRTHCVLTSHEYSLLHFSSDWQSHPKLYNVCVCELCVCFMFCKHKTLSAYNKCSWQTQIYIYTTSLSSKLFMLYAFVIMCAVSLFVCKYTMMCLMCGWLWLYYWRTHANGDINQHNV